MVADFESIDIKNLVNQVGTSDIEKITVHIGVYDEDKHVWNFYVKLRA